MNNRQTAFAKGNNNFTTILIGIIVVVSFTSCFTVRNTPYFNTIKSDTTIQALVSNDYESIIQKKDVLNITVSSLNNELDNKFNEAGSTTTTTTINQIQSKTGFLVGDDGTIGLHYLGSIKAEGLTRKQLKEKLQNDLLPYMKEPIVNVQYINKKVTVLGEVGKPQILQLTEEQTPLLEVLVNSGDVTKNADKRSITIIRENSGSQKKVKQVNLEDHSYFSSPWYYVQPNDIVLVGIDKRKYITEERRKNLQSTLSLIASLVSLALIVINLIFKI